MPIYRVGPLPRTNQQHTAHALPSFQTKTTFCVTRQFQAFGLGAAQQSFSPHRHLPADNEALPSSGHESCPCIANAFLRRRREKISIVLTLSLQLAAHCWLREC